MLTNPQTDASREIIDSDQPSVTKQKCVLAHSFVTSKNYAKVNISTILGQLSEGKGG